MKKPGQPARPGRVSRVFPRQFEPFGFLLLLLAVLLTRPGWGAETEILTNAAQILSLSAARAQEHLPVHLRGIVTAAEAGWADKFFIQDETSGVFVGRGSDLRPEPGDIVEVTGITVRGSYAPTIGTPKCVKLGTAPLPEPRKVAIEQIMSGIEDGQRVEIAGIVRAVTPGKTNTDLEIASGGYRLHAFPKTPTDLDPLTLVGARVRVRGTVAASFNATLRHLLSVVLFVPLRSDLVIEQMETRDPFQEPLSPLTGIAQYRRDMLPGTRMHVKGVLTLQRAGEDVFLEDSTGGLHVRSRQTDAFAIGDTVEAVGFPDVEQFLPLLDDAVLRKVAESRKPVEPKRVSLAEIQDGLHHAGLIMIPAKLMDRSFRQGRLAANGQRLTRTVLMLQQEGFVFTAEAESPDRKTALADIPIGSMLEVTGVCFSENGEDKKLKSLQVLLPSTENFRIIARPSWFTPQRVFVCSGIVLVVALSAVAWTVMVSRRNAVLRQLIGEKETAQTELQEAHDLLEERVKERTAQLKFQITARKDSELEFKAVLTERTRLAQELHDTLEQTLTGIALQLDTTSKLFEPKPKTANEHLELARELVAQGQVDVRRSVWDLRSRALEQFTLPGALLASSKQLSDGTNIRFEVMAKGRVRPLSETVEENLLRIAQEAMTNIVKHSQATSAEIELDYGPKSVGLRIKDNGRGFEQQQTSGPESGHFGLLGITERAKRLGAELSIGSVPGKGTSIRVQVALESESQAEEKVAANGA
ncbi:MAG TPA: histidine kinase [Candidatus Dormibacteraeota bacterium]|nr:histidine kinase [Candidatus Dormibacteraeota bacterium]